MKKNIALIVLATILCVGGVFYFSNQNIRSNDESSTNMVSSSGGSDEIILSPYLIDDYLEDKYTSDSYEYISTAYVSGSTDSVYVGNASQTTLNTAYFNETGIQITGTCANVAVALLINYYEDNDLLDGNTTSRSVTEWFILTFTLAYSHGLTTLTGGTYLNEIDNIITVVLDSLVLDTDLYGDNEYANIYSKIKSNITADEPALFHMEGHSTVARGYTQYNVTVNERYWSWFQYKWREITITEDFLMLSEGWRSSGTSYYDVDLISDGALNTGPDCMSEIIE